jgi:hypothetical protein
MVVANSRHWLKTIKKRQQGNNENSAADAC